MGYFLLDNGVTRQYGFPRRYGARASGTIILHDAEGGTDLEGVDMGAENVANFIRNRTTYGSYHRLVDRDTRILMAPLDYETWHSIPDNPWSVGVCVAWTKADLPRMTRTQRDSYYVPFAMEVLDVRREFAERGIVVPVNRFLTRDETQARKPGISTHSRTDPTRRSDPFGTGSVYESEFLEVLNALADTPVTPAPAPSAPTTQRYAMDRLDLRNAHNVPVRGRHVDNLQGLLLAAGYGPSGLVGSTGRPDGIAGASTRRYVGEWQVRTNTGDGQGHADYIVGDGTWRSLIEY